MFFAFSAGSPPPSYHYEDPNAPGPAKQLPGGAAHSNPTYKAPDNSITIHNNNTYTPSAPPSVMESHVYEELK